MYLCTKKNNPPELVLWLWVKWVAVGCWCVWVSEWVSLFSFYSFILSFLFCRIVSCPHRAKATKLFLLTFNFVFFAIVLCFSFCICFEYFNFLYVSLFFVHLLFYFNLQAICSFFEFYFFYLFVSIEFCGVSLKTKLVYNFCM